MTAFTIFKIIAIMVIVFGFLIYLLWSMTTQSKKDWATLRYLQEKMFMIQSKEELDSFWHEFMEKASTIQNPYIFPQLKQIEGYLQGLGKKFED